MKSIHDKYITIQGWMVTALKLKGSELQLFALIHGFCQDGKSRFSGSLSYIETWLNASRPTAIAALNRLTMAGWIVKHPAGGNEPNEYSVNWTAVNKAKEVVKNLYHQAETGSKETLPEVVKNLYRGSKETLPNIYSNTDIDNIENAPAIFHVELHTLETIPTNEEGYIPRPAPAPTSKISELQTNMNAGREAAAHFLQLVRTSGYDLGTAAKYAEAYFLHKQKKGDWYSLLLPDAQRQHRWMGEHCAGVVSWEMTERKLYPAQTAGTPTTPSYSNYKPKE